MDETTPTPATEPGRAQAAGPAAATPAAPVEPVEPVKPVKVKKEESWWDTIRFLLYLFIGAVLLRTFLFAPFSIPTGSMMPNLLVGDYLFVSKWSFGYSRYSLPFHPINFQGRIPGGVPERGDVVVFRHPGGDDWVKRVIGLPGDRVEVREGVVILNGQPVPRQRIEPFDLPVSPNSPRDQAGRSCLPEREGFLPGTYAVRAVTDGSGQQHCLYPRYRETLPNGRSYEILDQGLTAPNVQADGSVVSADNFASGQPITVPPGHLFLMGDNRDDSMDSRFSVGQGGVGLLPIDNVLGRAMVGFWSTDGSAEWIKPWTWFTAARWSRLGRTY